MVYCSKCGKKQKDNVSFCSDCGKKVKKQKVTKTETQVTETHKSNHDVEISRLTSVVVIVVVIVLFIFASTDKLAREARQNENTVIRAYNCILSCPTEFLRPNCIKSDCYNGCMHSVKSIVGKTSTVKANNAIQCMNNCHQEGLLGTCIERDSVVACSYHLT